MQWEAASAFLSAIDAALVVFDPAIRPNELAARWQAPLANAGNAPIQRFLLDMMRQTGKPLRTLDAAKLVMIDRGNKLARGKFTAVFLVQCLEAIGATDLRI